ncbi:MAG: hypothetical protein ACTSX8_04060 [Alphaproteobacteria bacterium]
MTDFDDEFACDNCGTPVPADDTLAIEIINALRQQRAPLRHPNNTQHPHLPGLSFALFIAENTVSNAEARRARDGAGATKLKPAAPPAETTAATSERIWQDYFLRFLEKMAPPEAAHCADRALTEWHFRWCEDCLKRGAPCATMEWTDEGLRRGRGV